MEILLPRSTMSLVYDAKLETPNYLLATTRRGAAAARRSTPHQGPRIPRRRRRHRNIDRAVTLGRSAVALLRANAAPATCGRDSDAAVRLWKVGQLAASLAFIRNERLSSGGRREVDRNLYPAGAKVLPNRRVALLVGRISITRDDCSCSGSAASRASHATATSPSFSTSSSTPSSFSTPFAKLAESRLLPEGG